MYGDQCGEFFMLLLRLKGIRGGFKGCGLFFISKKLDLKKDYWVLFRYFKNLKGPVQMLYSHEPN